MTGALCSGNSSARSCAATDPARYSEDAVDDAIGCAACGEQNPARARFCLNCGGPLQPAGPAGAEERKVVTILFCDLVGFTARSDQADPEDVRAALRPYHARVRTEIERFGGTVEKFIGDAVMGAFGAPVAHEDDAERAVRVALRVLDAIEDLNAAKGGWPLAVRVGIATGPVVVALQARPELGEGIVTGDVVNTAARLQAVAPVGGIVVGEGTWRASRAAIEYAELAPVEVKGKAAPLPIWQALRARSRVEVGSGRPATPFVGREDELATLRAAFARALREREASLITVLGEPGIGKTRLLSEFSAYVDARSELVVWRQGACLPYGEGVTFGALGDIVKAQAGILESDDQDALRSKLVAAVDALFTDPAERDWVAASLGVLVGLTDETGAERAGLFTAWLRFLEAVAGDNPLILRIEDLHWAEPALLDFLEHVLDWSAGVPLLVVATARPELYERAPGWGGGRRNSLTIGLGPLSGAQTHELLEELLGTVSLPERTWATLLDRAGGNPLYAEQFASSMADLDPGERGDPALPCPETVQALIEARLDTLPSALKTLLADASVVGRVFWSGVLAEMGAVGAEEVRRGLQELGRREFIHPLRTSSMLGQREYAFWHALTRDAAYARLPRAARAARHRAAAAWLERVGGQRDDHADILAAHYDQAVTLLTVAGETAAARELAPVAAGYFRVAADRASWLNAPTALAYFERILDLLPPGDPQRPDVQRAAGRMYASLGDADAALRLTGEALEAHRAQQDSSAEARTMILIAGIRGNLLADLDGARGLLVGAVELLEAGPPEAQLADALGELAIVSMLLGRSEEALGYGERTVQLAQDLDDPRQLVYAYGCRGVARLAVGRYDGLADLRESLTRATELGVVPAALSGYTNYGEAVWLCEGAQAGADTYAEGVAFARARGLSAWETWMTVTRLRPLFDLGHWDEVLAVAEQLGRATVAQQGFYDVLPRVLRARVLLLRGDAAAAISALPEVISSDGGPQTRLPQLTVAAQIAAATGDRDGADTLLTEALAAAYEGDWFAAMDAPDLIRLCAAAGRSADLDRLIAAFMQRPVRHRAARRSAEAVRCELDGAPASAAERYADAAAHWHRHGSVLEEGYALLGQARCRTAAGGHAVGVAQQAEQLFSGLGVGELAGQARLLCRP